MLDLSLFDLLIREITADDESATARLSEELGYPVSEDVMKERIQALNPLADHVIYVACLAGEVVGCIDIRETHYLFAEPRAEIAGLVVASKARGAGIGRRLVAHAQDWARQRGLRSVVVRSRVAREDAHRFYLREGYVRTKTSAVFTKELG